MFITHIIQEGIVKLVVISITKKILAHYQRESSWIPIRSMSLSQSEYVTDQGLYLTVLSLLLHRPHTDSQPGADGEQTPPPACGGRYPGFLSPCCPAGVSASVSPAPGWPRPCLEQAAPCCWLDWGTTVIIGRLAGTQTHISTWQLKTHSLVLHC